MGDLVVVSRAKRAQSANDPGQNQAGKCLVYDPVRELARVYNAGCLGAQEPAGAIAFFGLLIWLVVDLLGLSASNIRVLTYVIEIMLVGVLSAGVSWSQVRQAP